MKESREPMNGKGRGQRVGLRGEEEEAEEAREEGKVAVMCCCCDTFIVEV